MPEDWAATRRRATGEQRGPPRPAGAAAPFPKTVEGSRRPMQIDQPTREALSLRFIRGRFPPSTKFELDFHDAPGRGGRATLERRVRRTQGLLCRIALTTRQARARRSPAAREVSPTTAAAPRRTTRRGPVYAHALLWAVTGDTQYAAKTAEILDAWSAVLTTHGMSNAPLQVGWDREGASSAPPRYFATPIRHGTRPTLRSSRR